MIRVEFQKESRLWKLAFSRERERESGLQRRIERDSKRNGVGVRLARAHEVGCLSAERRRWAARRPCRCFSLHFETIEDASLPFSDPTATGSLYCAQKEPWCVGGGRERIGGGAFSKAPLRERERERVGTTAHRTRARALSTFALEPSQLRARCLTTTPSWTCSARSNATT